jgi:hypothetical protein
MIRDRFIGKRFFKKVRKKWNIQNAQDLKNQIYWFLNEGVRQEFDKYRHHLSALSEATRTEYLASLSEEHPDYAKLYLANQGIHTLPPAGIMAFDLAWCIYLCRIGRLFHDLTKEEAWNLMMYAAKLAQQSYGNWNEYMNAFLLGRRFEESKITISSRTRDARSYIVTLFSEPKSPLLKLEWNHPLFASIDIVNHNQRLPH